MRINLEVVGKELFFLLSKEVENPESSFSKMFRQCAVDVQLNYASGELEPQDFVCFPSVPTVVLIEAQNAAFIEKIHSMESRIVAFLKKNPDVALALSPVVVVFRSPAAMPTAPDLPDFISDWVFSPVVVPDLVRRIFLSLKRKGLLRTLVRYGPLILIPESRSLSFGDRTVRLTPSEYTLAEFFLNHMGTIISFKDLASFFKASGKSTEANNIRVAIFQFRLKLESLTRSQFVVASVYKQGYCLRQKSPRSTAAVDMLPQASGKSADANGEQANGNRGAIATDMRLQHQS
jgi:DNA-binding winged helix-turn-helix (wHTH) protein